ncbi:hypothetical protein ES703_03225 [subsurface metagenome]
MELDPRPHQRFGQNQFKKSHLLAKCALDDVYLFVYSLSDSPEQEASNSSRISLGR